MSEQGPGTHVRGTYIYQLVEEVGRFDDLERPVLVFYVPAVSDTARLARRLVVLRQALAQLRIVELQSDQPRTVV